MKSIMKRVPAAVWLNARLKTFRAKKHYEAICRHYATPSVLSDPGSIAALTRSLWDETKGDARTSSARPRVLFVGTDRQQDYSGLIQALQTLAEVTVFEHAEGKHGQKWAGAPSEWDSVREHNGLVLKGYLERQPFDVIVGQMWAVSMDTRVLARARDRGISVVNISMDDRHSFASPRLTDGGEGGTRGLVPVLSLACTAAAEAVSWYEAEGCRAIYLPEASDPQIFHPIEDRASVDVSFVGARYGVREKLVQALQRAGIRVETYGSGWPAGRIATEDIPRLFARSRIVLGCGTIGHSEDFVALKLRDFDVPMTGAMYITHRNPDLEPLFEKDAEMAMFETIDEMVEKVRRHLSHDEERNRIAAAGRSRALRDHTWVHRMRLILDRVSR